MTGQDKFNRFVEHHPHRHMFCLERPHVSRRAFFNLLGAGVTGSFLLPRLRASETRVNANVTTQNKAKNVIFILLAGGISHTDSFDLKMVPGVTPSNFNAATINGILWPNGILPKLGGQLSNIAIVRSVRAWALVHSLARTWTQIGRNPAAALGDIAPNIFSIAALEKESERLPTQVFPGFVAMNSVDLAGAGYLSAKYAPFRYVPSTNGLPDTTNPDGSARLDERLGQLHLIDDPLRVNSPLGRAPEDMNDFYTSARKLMYNQTVVDAFSFTGTESQRYGSTGFGNACLVAKQVLAANQGTRFISISLGGWDMHNDVYGTQNPAGQNMYTIGKALDDGLAALLGDLRSTGLLNQTLVVVAGEFGRTVGPLSGSAGRDHFMQQSILFAGAGVRGGRTIGSTDATGAATRENGWSRDRDIRPEDVEASIYSALGINWTTVRFDDPFGRGFEYVPFADADLYGPINELWS